MIPKLSLVHTVLYPLLTDNLGIQAIKFWNGDMLAVYIDFIIENALIIVLFYYTFCKCLWDWGGPGAVGEVMI